MCQILNLKKKKTEFWNQVYTKDTKQYKELLYTFHPKPSLMLMSYIIAEHFVASNKLTWV